MLGDGCKLLLTGDDGKSGGVVVVLENKLVKKVCCTERWNEKYLWSEWHDENMYYDCMVYDVHKLVDATKKKKFREIAEKMLHMVEGMWFSVW